MRKSIGKALYVLLPLVAYLLVRDIVRILLMFVLQSIADRSETILNLIVGKGVEISAVISVVDMIAGALVVIYLMKKDMDELSLWDYVNLNGISFYRSDKINPPWISWLMLAVEAVCAAVGFNALVYLCISKVLPDMMSEDVPSLYRLPIWLGIILYCIISPAVEELLHRIVIFGRLKRQFSYAVSVIASALFFGVYHMNFIQLIYGAIMGVILCLAVDYVHSIWGSFMVHVLANLTIYLLSVTGHFQAFVNVKSCTVFICITLVIIILQLTFAHMSRNKNLIPHGVERVGIFFIDETL